jgi:hypothetical protein
LLTGCEEQQPDSNPADKKSQAASEDDYPGLEWSKKRVTAEDGTEYWVLKLNDERIRIDREKMSTSPPGPYIQAIVAWTWPGLETLDDFRELEASGERFSVITIAFEPLKDPRTPFRDTVRYLHNRLDLNPPKSVSRWAPNPDLLRYEVVGNAAYYQLMEPKVRLPSGKPLIVGCSWLYEEGDGECEVTMEWSEEVGVQYAFTDHDLLKKLVPVHRAVTDFIKSVLTDTDKE